METVTAILQWLIPAGGIGSVVAWLTSRTLRNVRKKKEISDTYKTLYENISETLINVEDELAEIHKEMGKLRRAIARAPSCRYYDNCPVQHELQREQKGDGKPKGRKRQRAGQGGSDGGICDRSGVEVAGTDSGQ
jgi:hypothetical protein